MFRVEGAEPAALRDVIVGQFTLNGEQAAVEESVVGGKEVTLIAQESWPAAFPLYVTGDTAYLILMQEPYASMLLEAMP